MYECVCERESVCVCERERESVCVCVCERERECVCVCVRECDNSWHGGSSCSANYTYIHTYIHTYTTLCVGKFVYMIALQGSCQPAIFGQS